MHWYIAKLVYRIVCGAGQHTAQYDEQLRLVEAGAKGEAYEKADRIGQSEQMNFLNERQQLVQWVFIGVSELYRLTEVVDGAELYSRIEERDDAVNYERMVQDRAHHLQNELNTAHLQTI